MESMKRGFYTVTQLSKNMYLDNDGMLVCKNAVLGKAGTQAYAGYELGLDTTDVILLHRPETEVFDSESLSSLKGKTLTLNHPDEDVTAENYNHLAKGFVLDVRREGNLIIGDIKITDPDVIDLVMNKEMVELSLGYDTKLVKSDDGKFNQTEIVYNHLALVKKGRAEVARIVDGHKLRVVDKQFEKGGNDLEKDTFLQRVLSAIGLRKIEQDGKEVFILDSDELKPEEELETKDVTETPETETAVPSDDLTSVSTEEEQTDTTTVSDTVKPEVTVSEPDVVEDVETETLKQNVTDEKKEGQQMTDFEKLLAQAKEIESLQDEAMKQTLKDALLADVLGKKVQPKTEDEGNDALGDFRQMKDSAPEVEVFDFDKEYTKMIHDMNPHNFDSYPEYLKYRKKLEKEASVSKIEELLNEATGGKA